MKRRKAGLICVFCLFLAAILPTAGCSGGKNGNSTDERGTMNIDFSKDGMIHNGTQYQSYQVGDGKKGFISVRISKKSGRLDLDIYPSDSKDTTEYSGRELDSASFDVVLEKSGEYEVCFTAKKFIGEYAVSFRTEDK